MGHPQEYVFQCIQQLWITTGFAGQDNMNTGHWPPPPTGGLTLSQ